MIIHEPLYGITTEIKGDKFSDHRFTYKVAGICQQDTNLSSHHHIMSAYPTYADFPVSFINPTDLFFV